ncbi:MAG: 16S rRNA (guanine(527)-N(7))-methyltransferase RsmG [Myxococcota bacterium]
MPELQDPRDLLEFGFDELGREATAQQIDSLLVLSQLLFRWSKTINLTGHQTVNEIVKRLILDAVALAEHIPEVASLADIGSGAGFPGLPIAILRQETRVVLIDSRERRHHFQREVVRALDLENVQTRLGRAEQLDESQCSAAIAQAVAPSDALPLLLRWVRPEGLLLFPGPERPAALPQDPMVVVEDCVKYRVPCGGPTRTLRIARKSPAQ